MKKSSGKQNRKKNASRNGRTTAPVASSKAGRTSAPRISTLPSGQVRIRHREYLADQLGSVAFSSSEFSINPGLARSFPWLSRIASRFESYHFESLRFMFETEAPTSSTGVVILTVDYDPTDAAPLSKTAALAYEGAVRSAPWSHSEFRARKTDLCKRKSYFVRCGNLPANATLSLFDTGNLFVCTKGQATAAVVGELYVEYDVVLSTPQMEPQVQSAKIIAGGSISKTAIYGSQPIVSGCLDIDVDSSTITFNQAGECLVDIFVSGGTLVNMTTAASTATVSVPLSSVINSGATQMVMTFAVRYGPGDTLVFDASGSASVNGSLARLGEYQYSLG